jgi:hypothetical protein
MEKKNWFPRDDTPEHAAYDKRTPGLFKTEFTGDGMIALRKLFTQFKILNSLLFKQFTIYITDLNI